MALTRIAVFCLLLVLPAYGLEDLHFPPGFKFGVASAAYQVEGAWNVSDKSESVWDRYCHENRDKIADGQCGDVACDSYHQWRRDIDMIQEIGAHHYRFSISWSRLLPTGFSNKISEDGARYYNNLIDGLLAKGIEPMVTLHHFDLPQSLQDLGGWTNPLISDWFADYAHVCYSLFGDRVTAWLTINEPIVICDHAYNTGTFPPGYIDSDVSTYVCTKHVLLAHAKAYRAYDSFRSQYNGKISMANHLQFLEPLSEEYTELADLAMEYFTGRYSHAIYSEEGGWPPALKRYFEQKYSELSRWQSKLPEFTQDEIELIKGTYDFYAFNYYTSRMVRPGAPGEVTGPSPMVGAPDLDAKFETLAHWEEAPCPSLFLYPEGLRKQLTWLKQHYGDIPIIITENGYCSSEDLEDEARIRFYTQHLTQLLLSIKEDGVNVVGFTAWSLMDVYEWLDGFTSKLGLYHVDFSSPERTRTPRASAKFYQKLIQQHSLNFTL